ncbi:MAG: HD domain-containing protein [Selenomonadales bacterium]|nr:HD domain-containing protein [Selenomonadales bacterium]
MRAKQFWAAITARVTTEDRAWVNDVLSPKEASLFWQMNLPDQQHAIRVARSAMELAKDAADVDRDLLLRAALLHDVGKVKGDVSTADKVLTVIGHKFAPRMMRSWGREGRGGRIDNLRHACYVYFYHPQRSADLLRKIDAEEELTELVLHHHDNMMSGERAELTLLRRADEMH